MSCLSNNRRETLLPIIGSANGRESQFTESQCSTSGPFTESQLLQVQKPSQYLGGELNSVIKNEETVDLRFALAFPDTYEVGMSHIGLQILYDIINRDSAAWAERVYMPLPDMELLLKTTGQQLYSLESKRALHKFDIVGFSLQYELCGTNILAMLDLGGIPLLAAERTLEHPLILGGGPFSYHPEPLADFFDAFLLGDAEEAISDILRVHREWKSANSQQAGSREDLLERLSTIDGVYVPSRFIPAYDDAGRLKEIQPKDLNRTSVTRRLLPTMVGAPFPKKPIVPNIRTVHNRLSIEVMRGCVRGCRFCQAGYLYRPQRERSPQEILELIEGSLPETGYEELSLLSLSTADYCSIVPLLKALMDKYGDGDKLAISFPSTRVDALTPEVLEQVQRVRRTGFTVAPEAGTQRLRDVINKGVSDEQILETAGNVFRMGWTGIKLYFMLGLPTETDEDLQGIVDIARRIKQLPEARNKDITVSVSTLVPKPHTPFQWAQQIHPIEIIRRQRLLAEGLKKARVNFRYHDSYSTFLEGVFCRGDRRLSRILLKAYELGCRLDAWAEHLSEEKWTQVFTECNIDPFELLRERNVAEVLPWDHLSCGIPKSYFLKEWQRALRDKETPDCLTQSCSICSACNYDNRRNILFPRDLTEQLLNAPVGLKPADRQALPDGALPPKTQEPSCRMRVTYEKSGKMRFLGHLELSHVIQRAARRAGLPLAYSAGFHPMPRLAFGPPLQLGVESKQELVDMFLVSSFDPILLRDFMNETLPEDLRIGAVWEIPLRASSIQNSIASQLFRLTWLGTPQDPIKGLIDQHGQLSGDIKTLSEIRVVREIPNKKPRKNSEPEIKHFVLSEHVSCFSPVVSDSDAMIGVDFQLITDPSIASPKPLEIAIALTGLKVGEFRLEKIAATFRAVEVKPLANQPKVNSPSDSIAAYSSSVNQPAI